MRIKWGGFGWYSRRILGYNPFLPKKIDTLLFDSSTENVRKQTSAYSSEQEQVLF